MAWCGPGRGCGRGFLVIFGEDLGLWLRKRREDAGNRSQIVTGISRLGMCPALAGRVRGGASRAPKTSKIQRKLGSVRQIPYCASANLRRERRAEIPKFEDSSKKYGVLSLESAKVPRNRSQMLPGCRSNCGKGIGRTATRSRASLRYLDFKNRRNSRKLRG